MSPNKDVVKSYYVSFSDLDRPRVLSYLTDDVEWTEWAQGFSGSGVPKRGKEAFSQNISDPPGEGHLRVETTRMTEENDVVVAENIIQVPLKEGGFITIRALDIFQFEKGKIKRSNSFTVQV